MSFKQIAEIKKLGIFDDYSWKCNNDFKKNNLIFGFNGSGKSTLSNLFNLIACKKNYSNEKKEELFKDLKRAENAVIRIQHSNNEILSYPSAKNQNNKNIYVFNANFVADHVFNGQHGRIQKFDISETVLKKPEIKQIEDKINSKTDEKDKEELAKRSIEDKFVERKQVYNKNFRLNFPNKNLRIATFPNLSQIPTETKVEIELSLSQKLDEYKLAIKQKELEFDIRNIEGLQIEYFNFDMDALSRLLNKSAIEYVSSSLKRKIESLQGEFQEDLSREIEPWFKVGKILLEKSQKNSVTRCPLCDSDITSSIEHLIDDFSAYFNKSYEEFISNVKKQKSLIVELEKRLSVNVDSIEVLNKQTFKYNKFISEKFPTLNGIKISNEIKELKNLIIEKEGNSGKKISFDFSRIIERVHKYNDDIGKLIKVKTNIIQALKKQKIDPEEVETKIRSLYTKLVYIDLNGESNRNYIQKYYDIIKSIKSKEKDINDLKVQEIRLLRDMKIESQKVHEYLIKLGITHFTIDLNEEKDDENILIKYNDDQQIKKHLRNTLSEGEKTALAFAYFLSKVSLEAKNKNDTFILIDDPISSLDDNRLYHAAYLISEEFKNYKQLFILSHNLLFLKYLSPLFKPNSKSNYIIKKGVIEDLPKSLENFQSPYFYMLDSLIDFKESKTPDYEEARKYLPNYIRRILETFFSFKYAKLVRNQNKNQAPGLDDFIKDFIDFESLPEFSLSTITKQNIKDRLSSINKICDNFSHGNIQQLDECNFITNDTLKQLATETLEVLEYFDGLHFQNVEELVKEVEYDETANDN